MPLADVVCRKIKSSLRPRKLSDGGGLYLLVDPKGGRYWRLAYRFGGKQKTLALGIYPTVSLADARAARDEAKRQLAEGIDPSQARKKGKLAAKLFAENTFEALAREWHENKKGGWVSRHAWNVMRRLEADVFPTFGSRPITEIEAPDILEMLKEKERTDDWDV